MRDRTAPRFLALMLAGFSLTAVLVADAAELSAQQIAEISEVASSVVQTNRLPGLSVAVAKDGHLWSAGFGKADLEQDVPVTAQSLFRVASITKWFTAAAAMRLVEDGKLDLDAPVQQYCPQFPKKPWPITSRQLLTHLSGVRHYHGANGEKPANDAERQALEELQKRERSTQYTRYTDVIAPLDAFKDEPLLFEPGTRVLYTSLGYRVLGCVLEGAGQTPYRTLMRNLVFEPAGMTTIIEDDALAIIPHRVAGYSRQDDTTVRTGFRDVSDNVPAGGYLSNAEDLVRFAVAFDSATLVKAATRKKMLEHPRLANGERAPNPFGTPTYYYGMGIMIDPGAAQPAWFHTGGQSGTTTLLFYFHESDVAVGLMTNIDGGAIRESLARKIGEIAARN